MSRLTPERKAFDLLVKGLDTISFDALSFAHMMNNSVWEIRKRFFDIAIHFLVDQEDRYNHSEWMNEEDMVMCMRAASAMDALRTAYGWPLRPGRE